MRSQRQGCVGGVGEVGGDRPADRVGGLEDPALAKIGIEVAFALGAVEVGQGQFDT